MTPNAIIGLCLIAFAAVSLAVLVLWSRHIINRIDRTGPQSARKILQSFTDAVDAASHPREEGDDE